MRRPVLGYEGLYEVSDDGRVFSLRRRYVNINGISHLVRASELKPRLAGRADIKKKYKVVTLNKQGRAQRHYIHVLVLSAFRGPRSGEITRHLDGNPQNNNLRNLKWGTRKENGHDSVLHGTSAAGERSGHAKLTEDQVMKILMGGHRPKRILQKIADDAGVSVYNIYMILWGKSWRYLHSRLGIKIKKIDRRKREHRHRQTTES